jgi:hypothetical protein
MTAKTTRKKPTKTQPEKPGLDLTYEEWALIQEAVIKYKQYLENDEVQTVLVKKRVIDLMALYYKLTSFINYEIDPHFDELGFERLDDAAE